MKCDKVNLGKLLKFRNGKRYVGQSGPFPIYGSNGVIGTAASYNAESVFIIGRVGACGSVHYEKNKCWVSDNAIICEQITDVDPQFLFHFLKYRQLGKLHVGSNQPLMTKTILSSVYIELPSASHQIQIANTLSAVDKAIEQAEIAIEEGDRMKRGLMKKLLDDIYVPRGVCNVLKTKLGDVAVLRKEPVSPAECPGMKFVGLEHLISGQYEVYNYDIVDDQRSLKSRFIEGDVLYGKLRPYLDKGGLVSFDGCCSTDILVLIADKNKIIPEFISILLHKTDFIAYAMAHKNGTNHPRTSWKAIANYEFNLPPMEDQKRIVNVLKITESLTVLYNRRKSLLETIKRGMMQQLLAGAE